MGMLRQQEPSTNPVKGILILQVANGAECCEISTHQVIKTYFSERWEVNNIGRC